MKCPLCGSAENKQIINQKDWQIWSCQSCTNAWTMPDLLEIKYEDGDFHAATIDSNNPIKLRTMEDLPELWQTNMQKQLSFLTRHLKPGAKILEIGCGEGIFLDQLSKLGFITKGVEPSLAAVERATQKGLNVIQGYFPHPDITEEFDVVVMSHVLEHIPRPLETLEEVAKIAPQGFLFLIQTHYKGLYPRLAKHKWYWVPDQHYWHFTPDGIVQIASKLSHITFEAVACEFSSLTRNPNGKLLSKGRFVAEIASLFPSLEDQFHLLLRSKKV